MPVAGPKRRRVWRWALPVVVVLLLAGAVPVALVATGAADAETPAEAAAPTENPTTVAARQVSERITAQLDRQATALLAGDRAGFLAIADRKVHSELRRRFAGLQELRVTRWEGRPNGLPTPAGSPGEWRLSVEFHYCFVVPDCRPSPLLVNTRWRDGAEPRLIELAKSTATPQVGGRVRAQAGTLPWEVSKLAAAVGKRTIVGTTPAYRDRLPELLRRAEAAARVADEYVVDGAVPDRYRIFYAGPKEWQRWYGGDQPEWGAGYAVNVGGGHYDVVLGPDSFNNRAYLDVMLRHELVHAVSLPDNSYWDDSVWWLIEGLAEHAGADGVPVARYDGLIPTRKLVKGDWNGKLDSLIPAEDASAEEATGSYGISYLAVRYLLDRFGERKVLAFVKAVVHDLRVPRQVSEEVFGKPWGKLQGDCAKYIRRAVG
ncbi:hypothetical protein C1I93_09595 [Micromonospora endophytica]|uniref:Peptidase MA superfamily n=1 Tax=Micromonospora endophytica TaxID=515350 RepID=A0A2W2CFN3_9ACTN|nr:hypothetical protein C1I93_09595 [Micromonospora endophytica]RIW48847.1 hypothetical protein D3H59_06580 [Micromonospora endophytica]